MKLIVCKDVSRVDNLGAYCTVHDATKIPRDILEHVTEVLLFNQTTSDSIAFMFENFFHLVYDSPSVLKKAMRESLFDPNNYLHLHVNIPKVEVKSLNGTTVNIKQTNKVLVPDMNMQFMKMFTDIIKGGTTSTPPEDYIAKRRIVD